MPSLSKSDLLKLASEVHRLTTEISELLLNNDISARDSTPTSDNVPSDPTYNALRDRLNDTASDLLLLVNGPKTHLRRFLCTHNDLAAYQIAIEFDLFSAVPLDAEIDISSLALKTGLDTDIVGRVMRLMCTQRNFFEVSEGRFVHTHSSAVLAHDEDLRAAAGYQLDEIFKAAGDATNSIRSNLQQNESRLRSPFEERHGAPMFRYYAANPKLAARFAAAMAGVVKLDRQLYELRDGYPWQKLQKKKVVDIGGGSGHISIALARTLPSLSIIVQDGSQQMLNQGRMQDLSDLDGRITFMQHDFFTPQPISGVGAYFIRQVLHNWSDADCARILKALVPALENCDPGTPLLINDTIIPEIGTVSRFEEHGLRQMDMMMYVALGAKQRTKAEFESILQDADPRFEIVKVHSKGSMGLLEVHLNQDK